MTLNIHEVLTDPNIKMLYVKISNRFIDCTRSIDQEASDLQYALKCFCAYSTQLEKEVEIIYQEVFAAQALLTMDFKKKDSGINKFKHNIFNADKYRLSAFVDAGKWPNHKRKRYILFQRAKERVWSYLKRLLSDDMQALFVDFTQNPNFSLPREVYSYAPRYLRDQWAIIDKSFSDELNSLEEETKEKQIKEMEIHQTELNKIKNPYINKDISNINQRFWIWVNIEHYRKSRKNYESDSVRVVEQAEKNAMAFLNNENESLVAYYNKKNPEQSPYAERYQTAVSLEPTMPYNRHRMASLPDAFSTSTSASIINEADYL